MGIIKSLLSQVATKIVLVLIVVSLLIGGFFILKYNPFGWEIDFFCEPKIDDTENIVEEVKKISEFTTACYYEEFVIHEKKLVPRSFDLQKIFTQEVDSVENEIVLLVSGKVRAGFNLSKISEADFVVVSDTLSVKLPSSEVFDVIINPSNYEIFVETGKWSHEEIQQFQIEAKQRLLENAMQEKILDKATEVGLERLENLFKTFGFTVVNIKL